eukprot:4673905-Pyramimonas_sp.AAC.2
MAPRPLTAQRRPSPSENIAIVCALVVTNQMEGGRHFVLQRPQGSDIFRLPPMRNVMHRFHIARATFPQRAV